VNLQTAAHIDSSAFNSSTSQFLHQPALQKPSLGARQPDDEIARHTGTSTPQPARSKQAPQPTSIASHVCARTAAAEEEQVGGAGGGGGGGADGRPRVEAPLVRRMVLPVAERRETGG